jgi:putative ABC transport system permease protein
LVSGEPFDEQRKDQIVVNEAFVRRYLRDVQPVGTVLGAGKQMLTITGVVRDVRHIGLSQPFAPEVFMPFSAFPLNPVDTAVRTELPTDEIEKAMRRELRGLDAQLALGRVMTMQEVIDDNLARPRFQAVLLTLFAAVGVALAAIGAYAVVAQNMRSRIPELALRRALGAATNDVLRLVVFGGMKAPLLGLIIGMLLNVFVAARFVTRLLYGVAADDLSVFLTTAVILVLTSFLACALPGRAAVRVEPSRALHHQ